jgi:methionine synthase II (cobalamin-independent)
MFSTLLGALPAPATGDRAASSIDEDIVENVADLEATGLGLLSSGLPRADPSLEPENVVRQWRTAAAATSLPVKAAISGPYSAGRAAIRTKPVEVAERLAETIRALFEAGCPFVEIDEPDAIAIASDDEEKRRFVAAHRAILDGAGAGAGGGVAGGHLSLTLTGGNLDQAGPATFFDLPYASYAFDLIAGPENWRLIAAAPPDRGIVCGALDPRPTGDETREVLIWAAHYAASTAARGTNRIGLANASSLAGVPREVALRKLRVVAEAVRVGSVESTEEMARLLDPRAFGRRRNRPRVSEPDAPPGPSDAGS